MEGQGAKPAGPANEGKRPGGAGREFLRILKNRSFLYLATAETVRMTVIGALLNHIMPYLGSIGMSRGLSGTVAAAIPLVSILGRLGFGWCGDRFDKKRVYALIFLIMSVALFAFRYVHSFWVLLLFVALFAPAFGGGMVLRGAILQEYFGMASFGKMLGVIFGFASVGGIIGPTLAGWVFDTQGSYHNAWLGLFALATATIFLIMRIEPTLSPPPAGPVSPSHR
jgi:MFS family permease